MRNTARWMGTLALALLLLLAPACRPFGRKKPRNLPPTPIPPAQPRVEEQAEMPEPPDVEERIDPAAQPVPPSVEAQGDTSQFPPPHYPRRGRRVPRAKQPAVAEEPAVDAPPAGTPPPAPQPRLGELLTPEELREHAASFERSLHATRDLLAQILKYKLTADQSQSAARIQTFLRQAEETRRSDLVAAVNLARRAELLARDLLSQLP